MRSFLFLGLTNFYLLLSSSNNITHLLNFCCDSPHDHLSTVRTI